MCRQSCYFLVDAEANRVKEESMGVRLEATAIEQLEAIADFEGLSKSAIIRKALRSYITAEVTRITDKIVAGVVEALPGENRDEVLDFAFGMLAGLTSRQKTALADLEPEDFDKIVKAKWHVAQKRRAQAVGA